MPLYINTYMYKYGYSYMSILYNIYIRIRIVAYTVYKCMYILTYI